MHAVSIFNDVIGPVMRGPSSSPCAAARRIGRLARDRMDGDLTAVLGEFDRAGSLPLTHGSQGSDRGLFGGLLGWEAGDERLPDSAQALANAGVTIRLETVEVGDPHLNTYRLTRRNAPEHHSLVAISTGGGMMEVISVDGIPLSMDGGYHETLIWRPKGPGIPFEADEVIVHDGGAFQSIQVQAAHFVGPTRRTTATAVKRLAPVLPVPSGQGRRGPFTRCAGMLASDGGKNTPLWKLAVAYERARGNFMEREVIDRMIGIGRILRRSIASGRAGTTYTDRVLGRQSGLFQELLDAGRLLDGGALNRIVLYGTALMEVKSSMGVIVAAPTAGACAALPGAVIGMAEALVRSEEDMARAMLASGPIGVFIATRWTFAAEEGGCQAAGGSAAAMAAGALVTMAGGTLSQSVAAASLTFLSMLGLICDPIAKRGEAPCLGKNVMAASSAVSCANMALANFDPPIPFDEVVDAAKNVATLMPREHRCTSLGGLALTPASHAIERRLAEQKAKACGPGCGGGC